MNANVDFPRLVKKIREARGLTQEQLAHDLGVTFGTVNGWENGKHRPIQALATMLLRMASDAGISLPGHAGSDARRKHRVGSRR